MPRATHPSAYQIPGFLAHYRIDDDQFLNAWLSNSTIIPVDKEQAVLQTGSEQTHIYIILSGLIRYFYTSPGGKEWNKVFFREQQIVGSLSALLTQSPSRFSIAALEPCQLISTPVNHFIELSETFTQARNLQIQITEELFLRNERREGILLTGNTEQRYQWLVNNEAWLLDRVPQYQLASYLGMDAVSFSRIKSKQPPQA